MKSLNLMPPERRRGLQAEAVLVSLNRALRSVMISLILLTVVGAAAGITMWIVILMSPQSVEVELSLQQGKYHELKQSIQEVNDRLDEVAGLERTRLVWGEWLGLLLAEVRPDMVISSMQGRVGVAQLSLAGQASARSSLVRFEEQLRQLSWVSEVEAPTSNLLNRDEPEFVFDLKLTKKDENEDKD